MLLRAATFLVPLIALAQIPPPEVDQALRARVTEFLQYHVDGKFTKAFEYVADDTKEYYFNSQKVQFISFHLDDVKYSDHFTKAEVHATVEHNWTFQGQRLPVKTPQVTTWVIENGKWVWHYDPEAIAETPMGRSAPPKAIEDGGAPPPPAILTQKEIDARARQILKGSSVDKDQVTLAAEKASSDQVVFHNGNQGSVKVFLDPGPKVDGFQAELDKSELKMGEDAIVKVSYAPTGLGEKPPVTLRLTIMPFNQVFSVTVKFAAAKQ